MTALINTLFAAAAAFMTAAAFFGLGRSRGREKEKLRQSQAARRAAEEAHNRANDAAGKTQAELDKENEHWLKKER